jgi:peroxiredoxin
LRAYQAILSEIRGLGAELVAVSPELPDGSLSMAEQNALEFEVLSDVGNVAARAYGLVYRLPDELLPVYRRWGIVLPERNGDDSWELPVPGTFVVGRDGFIRYAFADSDYTRRAEPSAILEALRSS